MQLEKKLSKSERVYYDSLVQFWNDEDELKTVAFCIAKFLHTAPEVQICTLNYKENGIHYWAVDQGGELYHQRRGLEGTIDWFAQQELLHISLRIHPAADGSEGNITFECCGDVYSEQFVMCQSAEESRWPPQRGGDHGMRYKSLRIGTKSELVANPAAFSFQMKDELKAYINNDPKEAVFPVNFHPCSDPSRFVQHVWAKLCVWDHTDTSPWGDPMYFVNEAGEPITPNSIREHLIQAPACPWSKNSDPH